MKFVFSVEKATGKYHFLTNHPDLTIEEIKQAFQNPVEGDYRDQGSTWVRTGQTSAGRRIVVVHQWLIRGVKVLIITAYRR